LIAVYGSVGVIGRHCIYELQDANPALLDDEAFVRTALEQAVEASGATLLQLVSHKFQPQGVTAIALLSESHISFHSYPEFGYAAVDSFTCGEHTDPEAACHSLKYAFESKSGAIQLLTRRNSAISPGQPLDENLRSSYRCCS
jgi:S-adenosylmethionine decarboxylase